MIPTLTALLLSLASLASMCHSVGHGTPVLVKYYSKGTMEHVLKVRARQGYHVRYDVDGWASRPDCSGIGSVFSLSVNGDKVRRYQQMDCAQPRDYASQVARHLVEIDWDSAVREGISREGKAGGTMWSWR